LLKSADFSFLFLTVFYFLFFTIFYDLFSNLWMTSRYGSKLNFEKELGLRLKGENGIMKKKFSALQKDIEDQREEIRTMFAHKKELYQVCLICKLT